MVFYKPFYVLPGENAVVVSITEEKSYSVVANWFRAGNIYGSFVGYEIKFACCRVLDVC
nr:hypothetical protein [Candidatus Ichthyocystis hellenicum]